MEESSIELLWETKARDTRYSLLNVSCTCVEHGSNSENSNMWEQLFMCDFKTCVYITKILVHIGCYSRL